MTWLDRVIDERKQLEERIEKLSAFLQGPEYRKLEPEEKERLKAQFRVMRWYAEILTDRIESA
jgi:hypothetical protein